MNAHAAMAPQDVRANPWIWAVSDDRRLLASKRGTAGPIRIWDAVSGRELKRFAESETVLHGVPVIAGRHVVTRGEEKTLQVWDWQAGAKVRALQTGSEITAYTAFDDLLVGATHHGQLHVWQLPSGEKLHSVSPDLSTFERPAWIHSQAVPQ